MGKKNQNDEDLIEEVNLDDINLDVSQEIKEPKKTNEEWDEWENDVFEEPDFFSNGPNFGDKKDKGLKKMPVDRNDDKRRVGKGMQKFIDIEVPKEILDGMPVEIQELMKKGKKEGKITQDEIMSALPHAEDDLDLLDEIYTRFLNLKIEIVDNLDKENLFDIDKKLIHEDPEKATISLSEISDDSIRMYLNEIGRVSLLSGDEEVDLGRKIKKGAEIDRVKSEVLADFKNDDFNDPKEDEIFQEISKRLGTKKDEISTILVKARESRKKLAASNLRLVVSIAKKYMGRGLGLLDLIQEGNVGLFRAVDKFDPDKGFKFSTYATWWIRQGVTRAIADQARTIRVPVHMIETINKFTHTYRRLTQELTREPLMEELATELAMDIRKVRQIMRISQDILSLDAPVGSEEDTSLGDFIEDDKNLTPDKETNMTLLKENLYEMLDFLTPRERKIIIMRFGLDGGEEHTLEQVGSEFGVTRERIRQIEAKTLEKLRDHPNADRIKFF